MSWWVWNKFVFCCNTQLYDNAVCPMTTEDAPPSYGTLLKSSFCPRNHILFLLLIISRTCIVMDLGLLHPLQPGSWLLSCIWYFEIHLSHAVYWYLVPFFTVWENTFAKYIVCLLWFCQLWNLANYMVIRKPLWLGLWTYAFSLWKFAEVRSL